MIDFSSTTAFDLVRRMMVLGETSPSVYFLVCEFSDIDAVQTDIAAEVAVQFGSKIQILESSEFSIDGIVKATERRDPPRLILLILRRWEHRLIDSLDRNVILLTAGCQVVILADSAIANRTLAAAPNLRNRIADVLTIKPDEALRDVAR
jgi:hypothetical protein